MAKEGERESEIRRERESEREGEGSSSASVELKVISERWVKPNKEAEAAKQPHHLGPLDLIFLSIPPVQKGLLFATPPTPAIVDKLQSSLSVALSYFYPLAGRLATATDEAQRARWVYVDCQAGPGALLIHAAAPGLSVSDVLSPAGGDVPPAVASLFDLGERTTNHDGHTRPLVSVQVTELRDGAFVGFSLNHALGDGTSIVHFIAVLSEIFRFIDAGGDEGEFALPPSRAPVFEAFCPEGHGPVIRLPWPGPEKPVAPRDPGPLRERVFHFSAAAMAGLKARANQEKEEEEEGVAVSSFMSLSALVWRSITLARGPLSPDEKTSFYVLVNARPRIDPARTDNHFGNVVCPCVVPCTVGELLGHSLGWAAVLLSRAVRGCNHELIYGTLGYMAQGLATAPAQPGPERPSEDPRGPNPVIMGGSARFDMYGPEFGLGRAVGVRVGYGRDGAKVTANPGPEGGGSVELTISLAPHVMSALEEDQEFLSYVSRH